MASDILLKTEVEPLKEWLAMKGYAHRPGKAPGQVLQIWTPKTPWYCLYESPDFPDHYRVDKRLFHVIMEYLITKRSETR